MHFPLRTAFAVSAYFQLCVSVTVSLHMLCDFLLISSLIQVEGCGQKDRRRSEAQRASGAGREDRAKGVREERHGTVHPRTLLMELLTVTWKPFQCQCPDFQIIAMVRTLFCTQLGCTSAPL